ncbi:chaperonin alpha subunit [Trypanosoma rangeli SC58]|uniref:T-complex protein 1 subunit alpha n=1 Tax=Trypanosoma rangeli SC58 TaxID=429131 RepID=A0A061J9R1_TRYRA|nr:chaperonin alpha subunit [Trypanosoma rangeli SC58]
MQTKQKQALGINGTRTSGLPVRRENVTAAMAVANVVKSSLGPVGLDKMLVDDVGDVCVTNDGATILKSLDVEHPAARLLVDLAQLQDKEIGDGTTSVVILASELLKRAQDLIVQGIHATSIIAGYKLALREAVRYLKDCLSLPVDGLGKEVLLNVARTSMSSKILSSEADLFAKIVVDAILSVKTVNELGDVVYPRKAVSVLLQHGKSARESVLMQGFALGLSRAAQGMPTSVQNARIALIDFDLRAVKMKLGINITITDPTKAEAIRQRELDITKERIKKMIAAGANVILTSWGIEDSMMKYMVDEGVLGVRRVKKDDMRRIAKVTGAQVVHTLSDLEGEEVFDPKWLGKAESVYEERFGEDDIIIISGTSNAVCSSIICRGANYLVLEEMERALNDALWAVARTLEASSVVAGGGAVEVALSVYLENFAHTLGSREQLAIAAFSEALLVIPKTLALNAALDATDLVARLRVVHNEQQAAGKKRGVERFFGLDLIEGSLRNNMEAGVLEPQPSKVKSLHFATEAAITILRIDDCVRLNPEEEEESR